MNRQIIIPTLWVLLLAMVGCQKKTAPPPYLFNQSGKASELLEPVAADLGATMDYVASGADGGHSLNRSEGRARFVAQSLIVRLNGADHFELASRFMKALESDLQASGFELSSHAGPTDPTAPAATYDLYRSYTEPGGKLDVGEIRLWSTRMPDDRIRITVMGLDFP